MKLSHTLTLALLLTLTGCAQANTQATQPMTQATEVAHTAPTTQPTCEEDEPCWDCHTMGNRVCGPATAAPIAAPTEQPSQAPVTASISAPTEAPITAPVQPTVAHTAPTTAPVAVQPVEVAPIATVQPTAQPVKPTVAPQPTVQPVTCESRGMITAEDHSCVPQSFYASQPTATPQPKIDLTLDYRTALCHKIAYPEKSPICVGIK